jgi:hypothetical protein
MLAEPDVDRAVVAAANPADRRSAGALRRVPRRGCFHRPGGGRHVAPYVRVDGTKVWSLMRLERRLRPDAYGRVRGGYIARRRPQATDA